MAQSTAGISFGWAAAETEKETDAEAAEEQKEPAENQKEPAEEEGKKKHHGKKDRKDKVRSEKAGKRVSLWNESRHRSLILRSGKETELSYRQCATHTHLMSMHQLHSA